MNYGLIGEKLGHSFSKEIHEKFNRYDYSLKELTPDALKNFITEKNYKGLNVTIPYKQSVMPYLDFVSDQATKIGAVNTIVNRNGKLYGYNTDYYGFNYLIESAGITVSNKTVAILGTGGASKTAQCVLSDLGAKEILTVSRSGNLNYDTLSQRKDIEIIVNASPVGMYPNNGSCMVDLRAFPNLESVVDMVYNPFVTELLRRAQTLGIKAVNGLTMLVAQAKRACELFTDTQIENAFIDSIVKSVKSQTLNLTLVGMPGCGKTTLGKKLSQLNGKEFIDADQEFYNSYRTTAGEYIDKNGEKAFRDAETEVLEGILKQSRKVIATGGGAVLREKNRINMRANSVVIWVQRNINDLSVDNRPLSNKYGKEKLYEERQPFYQAVSDIIIQNDGTVSETIENLQAQLQAYFGEN